MKPIKYILTCSLVAVMAVSCEDYIDPIEKGSSLGPDVSPPTLVISYPIEGKSFVSPDTVAKITIELVAEDDVELKSIIMQLDGTEIGTITSFKDYLRADVEFDYPSLNEGDHSLTVTVEDLTGKSVSKTVNFRKVTAPVYMPLAGEVLYFPLDGYYLDLVSGNEAVVVGSPGFATGKVNDAYQGAADSYLEYPATGILGSEFSVAFWYKINAEPLRGGILAISAEGDSRSTGLRMLRENSGDLQNIGLNFGIGSAEVWMNPFVQVATDKDWMHIAISISTTFATVYVDGAVVDTTSIAAKIDWTGCSSVSIASGAPNFTYWEHFSDLSLYDEMHFFNRAITIEEVQAFFNVK